ncbi:MAG: RHS repeat-associated core domain-containing protein [Bacillota bacterium]|jgi:RHS repeat-associated protein
MEYSPFGLVVKTEGTDDIMKFVGKEMDSSGLYYFGARYYDPQTGHFAPYPV